MAKNQYLPDEVSPPGETLLEVLEERGISQADLAERTGRPRKTINEIVKGKTSITPETALQLERVLGVPAHFWNSRESAYREFIARRDERFRLEAQLTWVDHFPVREMIRRGFIPDRRPSKLGLLEALLDFFGIASPDQWQAVWQGAAFRKSRRSNEYALSAWLRVGQMLGERAACSAYDAQEFRGVLGRIRNLTLLPPHRFQPLLDEVCGKCGVVIALVPELPASGASGATFWTSHHRPVLMLSLRYKTDDHLWFTFFHEVAHILLHGKRDVFIEGLDDDGQREEEANRFAAELLIPAERLRLFLSRNRRISMDGVSRFAAELGIAPGIVVGRLQHDGHLPQTHCNGLKRRLEWAASIRRQVPYP